MGMHNALRKHNDQVACDNDLEHGCGAYTGYTDVERNTVCHWF